MRAVKPIIRDLKTPCPFCGSPAQLTGCVTVIGFSIECTNKDCGADIYFYNAERDPDEMIRRWMRRVKR